MIFRVSALTTRRWSPSCQALSILEQPQLSETPRTFRSFMRPSPGVRTSAAALAPAFMAVSDNIISPPNRFEVATCVRAIVPCNSIPSVSLTFGGKHYSIAPKYFNLGLVSRKIDLIFNLPLSYIFFAVNLNRAVSQGSSTCVGAVMADPTLTGHFWVVGDVFMRVCTSYARLLPITHASFLERVHGLQLCLSSCSRYLHRTLRASQARSLCWLC